MDRRTLLLGSGAAVVAAGGFGAWTTLGGQRMVEVGSTLITPSAAMAQTSETPVDTSRVIEMAQGNPDAAVTVMEFASFTCPHCANFHAQVMPQLKADYIDTGKIRFVHREVYFDRYGLWAAMIARCGGGADRYFAIADLIYDGQKEWIGDGQPGTVAANLRKLGLASGIAQEPLEACLNDGEMAQAMVAAYQANATEHEISATPSLVIDGETHANMSYAELKALLDAKLAN